MSRAQRQENIWPANLYARYLWLLYGLWEDIYVLGEAYKRSTDDNIRIVIAQHLLVDFDSLDELIKEFQQHIKNEELSKLSAEDGEFLQAKFTEYHRVLEPRRETLKDIRNNRAHRTGKPWEKAPKYGMDSDTWGTWEQLLVQLESKCDLTQWVDALNAALSLISVLSDFNLDEWYSISDENTFRYFAPLYPPGYYPTADRED